MTLKVVTLRNPASEEMRDAAVWLREYADRCERGELTEIAVVAFNAHENEYERRASFDDRWRLIGALEYAKAGVALTDG